MRKLNLILVLMVAMVSQAYYVQAWGNNSTGVPTDGDFVAIFGGQSANHYAAVDADGNLSVWGPDTWGDGRSNVQCATLGQYFTAYINYSGAVISVGSGDYGKPAYPSPFTEISAGFMHVLGIRENGTVEAWGNNNLGQCDIPTSYIFVCVSAGRNHSLGIDTDGNVHGWGDNTYGQRNYQSGDYVAIAGGYSHSLALASNGSITAWGNSASGACLVPSPNTGFVAIAAGYQTSYGLKANGTVVAWGAPADGALDVPDGLVAVAIAAGQHHAFALSESPLGIESGEESALTVDQNPGLGVLSFSFELSSETRTLSIFDLTGRFVDDICIPAGSENCQWNSDVGNGVYLAVLQENSTVVTVLR